MSSQVENEIRAAFGYVSSIPEAEVAPHDCLECQELRRLFGGLHWSAINPSVVRNNHEALALFGDAAFRLYLPAFMLVSLGDDHELNANVRQYTVFALAPEEREWRDRLLHRISDWTAQEMNAVIFFLRWVKARPDEEASIDEIEEAIRVIWEPASVAASGRAV